MAETTTTTPDRLRDGRLHITELAAMAETPAHCRWRLDHPRRDTRSLELGRAVHLLSLTDSGRPPPIVYPGPVRRGKAWEDFRASHPDHEILTETEMREAEAVAAGLASDPLASEYLLGLHEVRLEWMWCGVPCAGTVDIWAPEAARVVDLKTCQSAAPDRFRWDCRRYHYAAKLWWYANGLVLSGCAVDVREAALVAVPSRPPHFPAVYRLSTYDLEQGAKLCRSWIETYKTCADSGVWPSYGPEPMDTVIYELADDDGDGWPVLTGGEEA